MKSLFSMFAIALAMMASASAFAHSVIFEATLDGLSEFPPNSSPGTGTATVTVDLDTFLMRVEAGFSGLTGTTTAAHIHCCTSVAGSGPAGVATILPTFTGFPLGVTSGSYDHTFDLSLPSSYNASFITANGGTVSAAFAALRTGLFDGKAYLNIHTSAVGSGEIRGFLTPAPVPVPAALPLFVSALGGFRLLRRIRA